TAGRGHGFAEVGPGRGGRGGEGERAQLPRRTDGAGAVPGEAAAPVLAGDGTRGRREGGGRGGARRGEGRLRGRISGARRVRAGVRGRCGQGLTAAARAGLRDGFGVRAHILHDAACVGGLRTTAAGGDAGRARGRGRRRGVRQRGGE